MPLLLLDLNAVRTAVMLVPGRMPGPEIRSPTARVPFRLETVSFVPAMVPCSEPWPEAKLKLTEAA